jgi:hypothetical protein
LVGVCIAFKKKGRQESRMRMDCFEKGHVRMPLMAFLASPARLWALAATLHVSSFSLTAVYMQKIVLGVATLQNMHSFDFGHCPAFKAFRIVSLVGLLLAKGVI